MRTWRERVLLLPGARGQEGGDGWWEDGMVCPRQVWGWVGGKLWGCNAALMDGRMLGAAAAGSDKGSCGRGA